MYWRPLWTLLASSISLALLGIIFVEKIRIGQPSLGFWPAVAWFPSQVLVGFWLTLAGFLIALPSLFLPYMRQKTPRTQRPAPTQTQLSRRTLLTHGLNLAGLLGVGSVGVILGQIWREDWLRAHAYRLALPSETLVSNYYLPFLAWSPDSAYLAETRDGNLKSWNIATGQKMITYPLPPRFDIVNSKSNPCRDIAWSPDGQYLVSWLDSEDKKTSLGVWNAQTSTFFQAIPETSEWSSFNPGGVSWSPDSKRLAIGRLQGVQIWDITSARMVGSYALSKECASVRWSPDGRSLAAAEVLSNIVHVWDTQSGQHIQTTIPYRTAIHDLAWAPDSKRLALALLSAYADSGIPTILLWDVRTNQQVALQGLWHSGTCVCWSPDGTRLAAGGDDQIVQVWNVTTGARIFTYQGHTKSVYWLAWSPDGKLLASAGEDNRILIWDAPTL
ncbi:hypothetical protein KSC_032330 [Ktedonobacter sp. SOSP1-52]|uniref:WD40 repeat domain-containing protein n=1 Tax=Ktedonobacter sp. SOSP1-52 TaxID=2778366 RepID=UPI001914FC3D|nr:hypothetical protein [Ktedonobacter sp. SOSP1-52]GHO64341.1 hypothetical protein KSC_032330 [Ktedonobacter sp. SOSP1-52]